MPDGLRSADIVGIGTVRLAWREAGSGVPTLLVHPYPTDGRIWEQQLRAADEGRIDARLIAVDLPGFGRSSLPAPAPDAFDVEALAAACVWVCTHLGVARPALAGVGIGGTIAAIAAGMLDARALVLIGNKPGGDPPDRAESREALARDVSRRGSHALSRELANAALAPVTEGRAEAERMIGEADPRAIAALCRTIARRPDIVPIVASLTMPVIVAGGSLDPMSPPSTVKALARAIPGAELHVIEHAGHFAPIEAPEAVTALLARALTFTPGSG